MDLSGDSLYREIRVGGKRTVRYLFGIVAALGAGTAFNIGILIQKSAVDRLPLGRPLLRSLVRRPIWLSGVVLQFVFGTPLYILAVGLIGPAVVPGVMAFGLVVLASGAILVRKEHVRPKELIGIGFVIAAVAGFGLSHLSIDLLSFRLTDSTLIRRAAFFSGAVIAVAFICQAAAHQLGRGARPRNEASAAFHAVRAGLWYNVSNLSLGFISVGIDRLGRGELRGLDLVVVLSAVVIALTSNFFGVHGTQNALARGRAAVTIPLQDGVAQIVPVGVFFLVYRPYAPSLVQMGALTAAALLLMIGVVLLTDRLATSSTEVAEKR